MESTLTTSSADEFSALLSVLVMAMLVTIVLAYVIGSFLLGRIFKKAGIESWKAWVPVYNNWLTLELGGQPGFWSVVMLIPGLNIIGLVFYVMAGHQIGLKLEKENWFVLLMIFLPVVWLAWLAFDKSTWKGSDAAEAGGTGFGLGTPPLPADVSTFGAPEQPSSITEASPAEATSDTTMPPITPAPAAPLADPAPALETAAGAPQTTVQSPELVSPIEPTSATTMPDAQAVDSQPAVEYPSVDGILSPTESATPTEPAESIDRTQPPASV